MCGSFLDVYVATCVYMNDFVTCIIYSKFILYHITSYIYGTPPPFLNFCCYRTVFHRPHHHQKHGANNQYLGDLLY